MDGNIYYLSLGVIVMIAIYFFYRGHIFVSILSLALGAWIIYTHDEPIDITETIYKTIDDSAKTNYENRYKSEAFNVEKKTYKKEDKSEIHDAETDKK